MTRFLLLLALLLTSLAATAQDIKEGGGEQAGTDGEITNNEPTEKTLTLGKLSDEEVQKLADRINEVEEKPKVFRFGLAVTSRLYLERGSLLKRRSVSISPVDTTLQLESVDKVEVVVAGVFSAYPFARCAQSSMTCKLFDSLGFLAKVDLAKFGGARSVGVNEVIEGGLGLSYSLSSNVALTLVYERVQGRRLRSEFQEGEPIVYLGETLLLLDSKDNRLFVDDNISAASIGFVYTF